MNRPLYRLDHVRRSFGHVRRSFGPQFTLAVNDLSVRAGETLCLVGPTGAGKSTLLRLLAGLDMPDAGRIEFDGEVFTADKLLLAQRRRMTLVHQRPLLLGRSVRENVAYGLKLRGGLDPARVQAVLDRFGLLPLADQAADTLSGGQAQLVALARAVAVAPDVLLLDEPTAHLDPAHVALVEGVLADQDRERRPTLIWATHNLFQARRVASRVGLMLGGRLVEVAETEVFFNTPTDARTADFVQGKMVH
jgi:tungstate transport system ATP-binding protein